MGCIGNGLLVKQQYKRGNSEQYYRVDNGCILRTAAVTVEINTGVATATGTCLVLVFTRMKQIEMG